MKLDVIATSTAPAFPPLSQAIRAGSLIFVSGQVALDPETKQFVGPDITAQTQRVLENLRNVLEAGGSSLDRVVKVTAFLCDMSDFEAFNQIYMTFFEHWRPARSTVQVAGLAGPYTVEVEAIASVVSSELNA